MLHCCENQPKRDRQPSERVKDGWKAQQALIAELQTLDAREMKPRWGERRIWKTSVAGGLHKTSVLQHNSDPPFFSLSVSLRNPELFAVVHDEVVQFSSK